MTGPPVRRILFPTDLSDCAESAFSHAAWLSDRFVATLHVLHVREDPDFPPPEWADSIEITAGDVARDLGLPLAPEADPFDLIEIVNDEVKAPDVAAAILHRAALLPADLIVMGTHGRSGTARALLGSVAEAVIRHARCPVLTVRPSARGEPSAFKRILVAVDKTDPVPPEVVWAARLARAYHSRLDLLRVVSPAMLHPGASEAARRAHHDLGVLVDDLRADGVNAVPRVAEGDPARVIARTAGEIQADLVMMGSHGREGVRRALLGSVSETVIRSAPCPVFVARRPAVPAA